MLLHRCHLMANNVMENNCNIDADICLMALVRIQSIQKGFGICWKVMDEICVSISKRCNRETQDTRSNVEHSCSLIRSIDVQSAFCKMLNQFLWLGRCNGTKCIYRSITCTYYLVVSYKIHFLLHFLYSSQVKLHNFITQNN